MRLDEPCLEDVANSAHSTEAKMKSLQNHIPNMWSRSAGLS